MSMSMSISMLMSMSMSMSMSMLMSVLMSMSISMLMSSLISILTSSSISMLISIGLIKDRQSVQFVQVDRAHPCPTFGHKAPCFEWTIDTTAVDRVYASCGLQHPDKRLHLVLRVRLVSCTHRSVVHHHRVLLLGHVDESGVRDQCHIFEEGTCQPLRFLQLGRRL
eukprot:4050696-Pyramimonas_sp.AAC.1